MNIETVICPFLENGQRCAAVRFGLNPKSAINLGTVPEDQGWAPNRPNRLPAGTPIADCRATLAGTRTISESCNPINN